MEIKTTTLSDVAEQLPTVSFFSEMERLVRPTFHSFSIRIVGNEEDEDDQIRNTDDVLKVLMKTISKRKTKHK